MNLARPALVTALFLGFLAIGCSSGDKADCRDSDGKYVSEYVGCRGNAKAECHADYTDCDSETCKKEVVSIQLTACPPERPICQDQRDVNGPISICQVAELNKACGTELVVDGKPFVPDAIADLDHDGRSDLLRWGYNAPGGVTVALANADGSFRTLPPIPGNYGLNAWLADVDGDGNLDLVTDSYGRGSASQDLTITIFIAAGRGDGSFAEAVAAPSLGDRASPVVILDVNGDKRADIVSWDRATHQFTVLLGGRGPLVRSAPDVVACDLHDCPGSLLEIEGGDLNGDGFGDFVHVDNDGRLMTVLGSATGTLRAGPIQPTFAGDYSSNRRSLLADFDADGHLDFVELDHDTVWIHPGKGDATFRDVIEISAAPYRPSTIRISDLDGDGRPDLLFADRDDVVIVRKNTGAFTFAPPKFYQPGPNVFGFLGVLTPAPGVAPSLVAGSFLIPESCQ